jgi:microcystin-dependent protein
MWSTASAPTGWLICDGSDISRTTYSSLFSAIGTTFGSSDISTFKVPDLRAKFPLGVNGSYPLGSTGGSMTATLTTNELPAHNHTITDPGHTHVINLDIRGNEDGPNQYTYASTGGNAATETSTSSTTGITVDTAGSGAAFNIINSYVALYYIIKT